MVVKSHLSLLTDSNKCAGQQRERWALQRSALSHVQQTSFNQRSEEWNDGQIDEQWPWTLYQPLLQWSVYYHSYSPSHPIEALAKILLSVTTIQSMQVVTVNCARIIHGNQVATNGVVHVIDRVISAVGNTIQDFIEVDDDLSTLSVSTNDLPLRIAG